MPLATKNGSIITNGGVLFSKCGCCCKCKMPWCCNAPSEVYANLTIQGGKRQSQGTFGTGNASYDIALEFDPSSTSGTYTLADRAWNVSASCGTLYHNLGANNTIIASDPSTWPGIPTIQLIWQIPDTLRILINVYRASGAANYRRTGYLPNEVLNLSAWAAFGALVPAPSSSGTDYPCVRLDSLGELTLRGEARAAGDGADGFNYYSQAVGGSIWPDWSPVLEAKVSCSV